MSEQKDPKFFTKEEVESFFAFVYVTLKARGEITPDTDRDERDEAYLKLRSELLPQIPGRGVSSDHPLHLEHFLHWEYVQAKGGKHA